MTGFPQRLYSASSSTGSLLCVGLDPDPELMPIPGVFEFNREIVDATRDLVCAYKPNLSFYEALGLRGLADLQRTVEHIRSVAPGAVIIADGKRGDIGSSSRMYARAMFDAWNFDAATVNAWGGEDSIEPFLSYEDRGVFVWCRSSNPGAAELQDVPVGVDGESVPLYEWMAMRAMEWNRAGNVGLVVGATYPDELRVVRARCPGAPILVPGVGAQGGDLEASLACGLDTEAPNVVISSSRSIIYASTDAGGFADAARQAAAALRDEINVALAGRGVSW